jgi:hypothetical protein
MDKIISLLQSLFSLNKVASVTVPGVLTAAALAFLLRPTPPIDEVPFYKPTEVILDNKSTKLETILDKCRAAINSTHFSLSAADRGNYDPRAYQECQPPAEAACTASPEPIPLTDTFGTAFNLRRAINRSNQEKLEKQKQVIAGCMETEKAWQGIEKIKTDMANADITALQAQLTAAQQNLLDQQKANSTLRGRYSDVLNRVLDKIAGKRAEVIFYQESANYRQKNMDELTRADGIITARLGESGRLRPPKAFDDYISGLVNHVVGFVLLALALGIVVNPICQAVTTSAYDILFKDGF